MEFFSIKVFLATPTRCLWLAVSANGFAVSSGRRSLVEKMPVTQLDTSLGPIRNAQFMRFMISVASAIYHMEAMRLSTQKASMFDATKNNWSNPADQIEHLSDVKRIKTMPTTTRR